MAAGSTLLFISIGRLIPIWGAEFGRLFATRVRVANGEFPVMYSFLRHGRLAGRLLHGIGDEFALGPGDGAL